MIKLNVVYNPQPEASILAHENDVGKLWMSKAYNANMANISMNRDQFKPKPNDSLFIAEPMCVMPGNYDVRYLNQFKYIFTWATKALEKTSVANKLVRINFPSYKGNPQIDSSKWLSWNERADEVVFIANNKNSKHPSELYSLRTKLADWLHANSQFKVSWYGNMPVRKPYYKGNISNKQDVLRKVKFHVCIENCYDPIYSDGFLTEKLPDAWFSGTVPIYMGCCGLEKLGVSKDCYLDMIPFRSNFTELETTLKSFSEINYKEITQNYSKLSDKLYSLTSYENMFDIMLKTYA